jgi:hypothetical protein
MTQRAARALVLPDLPLAIDETAIHAIGVSQPEVPAPWLPGLIWPTRTRPSDAHARRTLVLADAGCFEVPARMILVELAELLELPALLREHQRELGIVALARMPADAHEHAAALVLFCDPRRIDLVRVAALDHEGGG